MGLGGAGGFVGAARGMDRHGPLPREREVARVARLTNAELEVPRRRARAASTANPAPLRVVEPKAWARESYRRQQQGWGSPDCSSKLVE